MKVLFTSLAFALGLAGCASKAPIANQYDIEEAMRPLECVGAEQCTAYWRRAQVWIAQNSRMKIQIATDAIIETYNVTNYLPVYSYRVTRESKGGGAESIVINGQCGNQFGCHQAWATIAGSFNRYVRATQ